MTVQRNYKDTVFRMIFNSKKELLSLYNALNGTSYTDEESLEINTLENAIYMNMKNDISFVFDSYLNLYEHQSSVNPNMPLRDLFYISDLLHAMVVEEDVNLNHNKELLESCRLLKEYAEYVETVRRYSLLFPIEQAVQKAVDECIQQGILSEFLSQNRAEAISMSIYEYNEEAHMATVRKEGYVEGREEGRSDIQRLISQMIVAGETDKLAELSDTDFLKEMMQRYHI